MREYTAIKWETAWAAWWERPHNRVFFGGVVRFVQRAIVAISDNKNSGQNFKMENDVFAVIREFQTKMDKYARMDSTDLGLEIINIAIAICAKSTKFDKPSDILQSLTVVEDPPPDVVEMVRDRYRQLGVI